MGASEIKQALFKGVGLVHGLPGLNIWNFNHYWQADAFTLKLKQ